MLGFHLVSDLDGTWIPERGHQGELRRLEASVHHQVGTVLTFATGRTFTSAMKLIRQWHLMEPDHLITDVGCALWHRWGKGIYEEDMVYASMVSARWPEESAERLVGFWMPKSVQRQFGVASTRRLALQPAAGVTLKRAEKELRDSMQACGMRADVLASHGRYLDVLPRGVDKGFAVSYLQSTFHLPRPLVCCGDSARDIGMLKYADYPVLMGDGFIGFDAPGLPRSRTYRTPSGGPAAIQSALVAFGLLKEGGHDH